MTSVSSTPTATAKRQQRWYWIAFAVGFYGIYIYMIHAGLALLAFLS